MDYTDSAQGQYDLQRAEHEANQEASAIEDLTRQRDAAIQHVNWQLKRYQALALQTVPLFDDL